MIDKHQSTSNPVKQDNVIKEDNADIRVGICTNTSISVEVSWQLVEDLLVTALEGGSNYWYLLGNIDRKEIKKDEPLVIYIIRQIRDKDISVAIYDIEEYDEDADKNDRNDYLGIIDKKNIIESFSLLAEKYPKIWTTIFIEDNYDANDADIWFQLVVMKEVKFG